MSDMAFNAYSGIASTIALTMFPEVDLNRNVVANPAQGNLRAVWAPR
jgi:hypothetical protein